MLYTLMTGDTTVLTAMSIYKSYTLSFFPVAYKVAGRNRKVSKMKKNFPVGRTSITGTPVTFH